MLFQQIAEPKLAHYAYLIGCPRTREAIIIDPQRDIGRYLEIAETRKLRIVAAAETHIHADYLSGLREFADKCATKIFVSDEGGEDWRYEWLLNSTYNCRFLKHGDDITVGTVKLEALHTPGHTPEHLSFLVSDREQDQAIPIGMLSGDFVFVGDLGRPDLLETAAGVSGAMIPAARQLYHSLSIFKSLPQFLQVWPAHGAGSACGKNLSAVPMSTVGYELLFNQSIKASENQNRFVNFILDGQVEPPPYFQRMKRLNREGPPLLADVPTPRELASEEAARIASTQAVALLDTRPWEEYADGHLDGSLSMTLNPAFPTTAGSYVEPEQSIGLVVNRRNLNEATLDLVRIGLDRIVGFITPEVLAQYRGSGGMLASTERIDIVEAKARLRSGNAILLDVRSARECAAGHIAGSRNISYTQLSARIGELPKDKQILVICQVGERSGYAASYLEKYGYDVAHVRGGVAAWKEAGEAICTMDPCAAALDGDPA